MQTVVFLDACRSILHALTETGLETYTGRAGHHLMQLLSSKNDSSQLVSYLIAYNNKWSLYLQLFIVCGCRHTLL